MLYVTGGQAWFMISCAENITEDNDWLLLERAESDRGAHFLPSSPSAMAWAPQEYLKSHHARMTTVWHVPKNYTCASGRVVGRWLWKTGNSCDDADNVGRKTDTFDKNDMAKVVRNYTHTKWVNPVCVMPPETFISCMDFVIGEQTPTPLPSPRAPSPQPTPPPEQQRFTCENNRCVMSPTGIHTLSGCQTSGCGKPTPPTPLSPTPPPSPAPEPKKVWLCDRSDPSTQPTCKQTATPHAHGSATKHACAVACTKATPTPTPTPAPPTPIPGPASVEACHEAAKDYCAGKGGFCHTCQGKVYSRSQSARVRISEIVLPPIDKSRVCNSRIPIPIPIRANSTRVWHVG